MQTKLICFPEILEKAKAEITETVPLSVFDFFGMTVAEFLQLQEKILPKKVTDFLGRRKATFFDYVKYSERCVLLAGRRGLQYLHWPDDGKHSTCFAGTS